MFNYLIQYVMKDDLISLRSQLKAVLDNMISLDIPISVFCDTRYLLNLSFDLVDSSIDEL